MEGITYFHTNLFNIIFSECLVCAGPILESKGMGAIFQKKGKEMLKKGKYLKICAKTYKIWKHF